MNDLISESELFVSFVKPSKTSTSQFFHLTSLYTIQRRHLTMGDLLSMEIKKKAFATYQMGDMKFPKD